MSDYLSNLAAKSLDSVATIRPRLASFYEAPQRGFALPPEPAAETGEVTNDVVSMPAQPREGRAAPSKRPAVTDDPPDAAVDGDHIQPRAARITATVVNDERSETPTPAPRTPRRTVDHVPEAAAVTSLPEPPIADAAVSETPREQRQRRNVPATTAGPDRAVERKSDSVPRAEMAQVERIAARVAPPEEQPEVGARKAETESPVAIAGNRQRPYVQPESPSLSLRPRQEPVRSFGDTEPAGAASRREPVTSPRERLANPEASPERLTSSIPAMNRITPSRIVSESQPALRVQPVARSPRISHQSPSAPDVHITIGRVEVRAVPAAEPPPRGRSTATSGLMNLDDYLRRRDGKGRR
jgi:hypothetical protein